MSDRAGLDYVEALIDKSVVLAEPGEPPRGRDSGDCGLRLRAGRATVEPKIDPCYV